jgi:YfiH family protein
MILEADGEIEFIVPNWPAPANVNALATTRLGGTSAKPYSSLNLASHVGDDRDRVDLNRQRLLSMLPLRKEPVWLNQVHGNRVHVVGKGSGSVCEDSETGDLGDGTPEADASYTKQSDVALVILVADCLPILLCGDNGNEIAALHAGWGGLADGVVQRTVARFESNRVIAWLGPAIGPCHYEVDRMVKDRFVSSNAFTESKQAGHWMFDLYAEASNQLRDAGVESIYGEVLCTHCDGRFFSYRRDGVTGRIAVLIWKRV